MMAIPWTAIGPLIKDLVAGLRARRLDVDPFRHDADPGGVNENFIGLAAIDHLGVTGHQLHAGFVGCRAHRLHNPPEILHRDSFFKNETDRKIKRARPAHREVVNRAVNGQFSDIAAREKDRAHDIRVGAERDSLLA